MFSRSRPCLRSRNLSAVLDSVAARPDEPLLFLYPRWFTSAIRQGASSSASSSINAPARAGDPQDRSGRFHPRRCCPSRRPSVGGASKRWLSAAAPDPNYDIKLAQAPLKDSGSEISQENNEKTVSEGVERGPDVVRVPDAAPASRLDNGFIDRDTRSHLSPEDRSSGCWKMEPRRRSPSRVEHAMSSKERFREFTLSIMKTLSPRAFRKLRYRGHIRQTSRHVGNKRRPVHWTDIVELLENMQQQTWVSEAKRKVIHIPEETVALLAGACDMVENIWYMSVHNGCQVRVLDAMESEGPYRKVVLLGSERAIELAAESILREQDRQAKGDPLVSLRKPLVPMIPSVSAMQRKNLPVPLIRGVWNEYWLTERDLMLEPLAVNDIPEPAVFSVKGFVEYVEDLVNSNVPRHLQKQLYSDGETTHRTRVRDVLVRLFRKETNQQFISSIAVNMALSYLCRHEFLDSARQVFTKGEAVVTVETFNILLRHAAKRQDLHAFQYILFSMSAFDIRPNGKTWIALLECVVSPAVKAKILQSMEDRGYLEDANIVRAAVQLTIEHMFSAHLNDGRNAGEFIESMNAKYGSNWLSTPTINIMLSVAVRNKNFWALEKIVEYCNQHQLAVDSSTFNLILQFFRKDIYRALWFIFRYTDRLRYPFDADAYERLFLTAFKNRSYNICRVLWRYACMEGAVSYKMRRAVTSSLTGNTLDKKRNPIEDLWRLSAGKVIVGLELHQSEVPFPQDIRELVPKGFQDNPIAYLVGYKASDRGRNKQLAVASALLNRDIEEGPRYKPSEPLEYMLEAASVLDTEWKNTPRPTHWMIQNAIHVPIKKRPLV